LKNRLQFEKSPYLLQHADNPVDWYPWGPEAFAKARLEDKPILLSIGYSTCHWCHVMEHEAFSVEDTAKLMNEWLVCVKLDREERPDVDTLYMSAVSALTGQGGWPLNVFLTPELKPFYGGTYFPPQPAFGRPSWKQLVLAIGKAWKDKEQRQRILEDSSKMAEALKTMGAPSAPEAQLKPEWLDAAFASFHRAFDENLGGFGDAPKFPMPVNQAFLLRYALRGLKESEEARHMALVTLKQMALGGIHDHLGGGFARYSTDARWHVPHFEKMLYDNAQLAVNYLEAGQLSGDSVFFDVARGIFDYVLRDLGAPQGGFYSAEDADSLTPEGEKVEGAFYVWTEKEILGILGLDAGRRFCAVYGVLEKGNVRHDPHGEFYQKNVLYRDDAVEVGALDLAAWKAQLFQIREKRARPHRDEKLLCSWNALMITALAKGWQVLGDEKYLDQARKAANFILEHLYDAAGRKLYRRWADSERAVEGMADDYAFFIQALLDLYESDADTKWLGLAEELNALCQEYFFDAESGAYFNARQGSDEHLLVRFQEAQDNVEPSAASVQALNLLRLNLFSAKPLYRAQALLALKCLGSIMEESPRACGAMLCALDMALGSQKHIVVVGDLESALLKSLRSVFSPYRALIALKPGGKNSLPFAASFTLKDGKPTAYICADQNCQLPSTDIEEALGLLRR
jgi:uncharacterized protein YyaL (SSP411 family)